MTFISIKRHFLYWNIKTHPYILVKSKLHVAINIKIDFIKQTNSPKNGNFYLNILFKYSTILFCSFPNLFIITD